MPELPALSGTLSPKEDDARRLAAAVSEAFAPGGALATALPGFEARPGQLQMADAVSDAFSSGGILLAEAGTGTGKTLAYLVPAVLSRQRVLVSTGTKNLQEQIFFKDLPVLRESLGIPFTATYMKGRGNYLCLHRFDAYRDGTANSGFRQVDSGFGRTENEALFIRIIDEWRRGTETGDRAEIEDLPEDLPLWKDVAATTENCIGAECPQHQECFITRMRQRAAESDIVIVNHHLLCADAAVRQSELRRGDSVLQLRGRRRGTPDRRRGHPVFRARGQQLPDRRSRARCRPCRGLGTAARSRRCRRSEAGRRAASRLLARVLRRACRCCGSMCRASAGPTAGCASAARRWRRSPTKARRSSPRARGARSRGRAGAGRT